MIGKPCPTCGTTITAETEAKMLQSLADMARKALVAVAARMFLVFAIGMAASLPLAILALAYRMAFR
jgi:uncharacterized membrane protein YvbJ